MAGAQRPDRARRWGLRAGAALALLLVAWLLRHVLLGALGGWLIRTDGLAHADAIVVLGGAPLDRAPEGARLLREGWAPRLVFTGAPLCEPLRLYGIERTEAALGRDAAGLDSAQLAMTVVLDAGTSTREEAQAVLDWARAEGADTLIVVTTEFHTRRAGRMFRQTLGPHGLTVLVHAASSSEYDASRWWASEEGLIMVNNEWMKALWYAFAE